MALRELVSLQLIPLLSVGVGRRGRAKAPAGEVFPSPEGHSMHRFLLFPLALLVLLPASGAEDKLKEEKPTTAAGEYQALKGEYLKALKKSDLVFEKAK